MTTLRDVMNNVWARRNGYGLGVCDELDDIDPCASGDDVEQSDDEIPLDECVEVLHREAKKIEAIG